MYTLYAKTSCSIFNNFIKKKIDSNHFVAVIIHCHNTLPLCTNFKQKSEFMWRPRWCLGLQMANGRQLSGLEQRLWGDLTNVSEQMFHTIYFTLLRLVPLLHKCVYNWVYIWTKKTDLGNIYGLISKFLNFEQLCQISLRAWAQKKLHL